MPNQTVKNGLKAKEIKLPKINFFLEKQQNFHVPKSPFYQDVPFSGKKWHICPEQFFLVQTIIITFIYLLALFIVQNLQNFFAVDPTL